MLVILPKSNKLSIFEYTKLIWKGEGPSHINNPIIRSEFDCQRVELSLGPYLPSPLYSSNIS